MKKGVDGIAGLAPGIPMQAGPRPCPPSPSSSHRLRARPILRRSVPLALIALAVFLAPPAAPALSHVLHYTRSGFVYQGQTVAACSTALERLAVEHGFRVTHSKDANALLGLKDYDLVVYDNNTDAGGAGSKIGPPEAALMEYMNAGGRFLGIGWAVFHRGQWPWYDSVLFNGLDFSSFSNGTISFYKDTARESKANPALARMWKFAEDSLGIGTDSIRLNTEVIRFMDPKLKPANPRGMPGVFILQDVRGNDAGPPGTDYPQAWVKYLAGGGRMLYTGIGSMPSDWTHNAGPEAGDTWLKRATYAYMRFLAGDFDSAAAVAARGIGMLGTRLEAPPDADAFVRIRDLRGRIVASGPGSAAPKFSLKPGVYIVTVWTAGVPVSRTLAIP